MLQGPSKAPHTGRTGQHDNSSGQLIANQSADDRPVTDFIIASMPKDCFKLETLENEGGPGREYLTKEIFFSLKTWTVENCKAELLHVLE